MRSLLTYARRLLVQRPRFSLPAVLILAAGLGAATAVFTLVDNVLLRPLPFPDSERIVGFWGQGSWARAELEFLREHLSSYDAVGAFTTDEAILRGIGTEPRVVPVAVASSDVFEVLGTAPVLGRALRMEDERPGSRVAVVSDGFWRRELEGSSEAVGRTVFLDDELYEIVGVMPAGFELPASETEVWIPLDMDPGGGSYRGAFFLDMLGRLKPGVPLATAQAEIAALVPELQEAMDLKPGFDKLAEPATVEPWKRQLAGPARTPLLLLLTASGLLLLVACVNVANLLLAQAVGREREMAIRAALGANRRNLFAQLLGEAMVLGLGATSLGLLLAWWSIDLLRLYLPAETPGVEAMALDGRVFAFAAAAGLLTALLFGSVPAFLASRADLRQPLAEGSPGTGSGPGRGRLRRLLVAGEMALAAVLTITAVSSGRSFLRLATEDAGFDRAGVVSLRPELGGERWRERSAVLDFYDRALERLTTVPGVESAGGIWRLPIAEGGAYQLLEVEGHDPAPGETPLIYWRAVTGDYFGAMKIALVDGALFSGGESLDGAPVGLVSAAVARTYWPGESAVGKRLRNSIDGEAWVTVVGVVGDVRHEDLRETGHFTVYRPLSQSPSWIRRMALVARTSLPPATVLPALRSELRALAPDVPVHRVTTLDAVVTDSIARERLTGAVVTVYGILAMGLAAVGIFGLLSFAVGERRREIGIHLALGAEPGRIRRRVVGEGLVPAVVGLALGLAASWGAARFVEGFLYEVRANDPATQVGVAALLLGIAVLASWLPASRAASIEPVSALRQE